MRPFPPNMHAYTQDFTSGKKFTHLLETPSTGIQARIALPCYKVASGSGEILGSSINILGYLYKLPFIMVIIT